MLQIDYSFPQTVKLDSLLLLLTSTPHDTTKLRLLVAISEEAGNQAGEKECIKYAQSAIELADKLLNNKLMYYPVQVGKGDKGNLYSKLDILNLKANAFNNIGIIYNNRGQIKEALDYFDKSIKIKEEIGNKQGLALLLNNVGFIYYNKGQIKEALDYFNKSLNMQEETGDKQSIALLLSNIGFIYDNQGQAKEALKYYRKSLKLREENGDKQGVASSCYNIGFIFQNQGQIKEALEYYGKSLKLCEDTGDRQGIANSLNNLGTIYKNQGQIKEALDYYYKSLKLFEEIEDKQGITRSLDNIGFIYQNQGQINEALDYYGKSLKLCEKNGDKQGIARSLNNFGVIYKNQGQINEALNFYNKSLKLYEETGDKQGVASSLNNIGAIYLKMALREKIKSTNLKFSLLDSAMNFISRSRALASEIGYAEFIRNTELMLTQIDSVKGMGFGAFEHYKQYIILRDSIKNMETQQAAIKQLFKYEFEKIEATTKAELQKQTLLAIAERKKQKVIIGSFVIGSLLVLTFLFFVLRERKKSEKLLLNILPKETAKELKRHNFVVPKHYEMVTVLFTDFKDFTRLSEKMSSEELVTELDFVFKNFDKIISNFRIEKIKTIGDSYMCVGGLPVANTSNAMDVVLAALDIVQFMLQYKNYKVADGKLYFEIRIGIHTGPVVAGVVGEKKFAYDLWGDTVNTASRMETGGSPGMVNISGSTYQLLQQTTDIIKLSNLVFTYRGKIPVKNKGEVEMYFVDRIVRS